MAPVIGRLTAPDGKRTQNLQNHNTTWHIFKQLLTGLDRDKATGTEWNDIYIWKIASCFFHKKINDVKMKCFWTLAKYDISRGTVCIMKSVIDLGKSICDWYIGDAKSTYVIDQWTYDYIEE